LKRKDQTLYNGCKKDPSVREDKESQLAEATRSAKSSSMLLSETMDLYNYLSEILKDPFVNDDTMVNRISSMLGFTLFNITGQKSLNLKVHNPERFNWNPASLLRAVVSIYLNFSNEEKFINEVASDPTHSIDLFRKTLDLMINRKLIENQQQIERFTSFINRLSSFVKDDKNVFPDEFPDQFSCQITYQLMKDPVTLPASKQVVDRSAIERHLLDHPNDPKDPFSNTKLTSDMLIPNSKLKEQIENFVLEFRKTPVEERKQFLKDFQKKFEE